MKQCTKCGVEKPEEAFEMQPSRGRRRSECRECRRIAAREWAAKRKQNPPQQKPETKRCNTCHEVKPISEFSPSALGYFHGRCKACIVVKHQEKRREQYLNDPTGRYYWPFMNEAGTMVKRCSGCHAEKPTSEFYTRSHGYFHSKCKECDKASWKARYDANPERYRTEAREYASQHPEERRVRRQRWGEANKEYCLQYFQEYNESHHTERLVYYRSSRHRKLARIWSKAHPEIEAEKQQRRRARKRNAPRIERIRRKTIIERDNWTCYLCGQICTPINVTLDHVIPLIHNGSHTADNLRVACRSCNCRKGAKHLKDFLK